jgi:hypothetical protein
LADGVPADLGEQRHGLLQVPHALVGAAGRPQEVCQVVVERSLAMDVAP